MENIVQDKIGLGNLQPLPKSFNSSKKSKLDWDTYKGQALDADYVQNLRRTQDRIQIDIQRQIKEYQKIYRSGV